MVMTKYIAAIDQGTSSTRFLLFDESMHLVNQSQQEIHHICPHPGWVEQDPLEILSATTSVITRALDESGVSASSVSVVGLTNQRETTIAWSKSTGQPLHNAIVWMDTRTADICSRLIEVHGKYGLQERTGLPIATYFSAVKLRWLLDSVPSLQGDLSDVLVGTVDSWLVWNLTGGGGLHITDHTNASRTQLYNLRTHSWDPELLKIFGIPESILPTIRYSCEIYGRSILGDQQAALFGQCCFEKGQVKNTYGTGCFMLMNIGETPVVSRHGLLTTVAFSSLDGFQFALEGSVAVAGAAIDWLRDNLGLIDSPASTETMALSVPDSGGVVFVPAFSGLYAPHWNEGARGVLIGMTLQTTRAHVVRAALESIAFQSRDIYESMTDESGLEVKDFRVDGGVTKNEFLMQFQSDLISADVIRPRCRESTAMGAALAAGLAVGVWKSKSELVALSVTDKVFHSQMGSESREKLTRNWKRAVDRSLNWAE